MIPVHQTIFGQPNGNCLQAAVASILELPLDDVPNFVAGQVNHWDALCIFLAKHDLQPLILPYKADFLPLGYYLAQGLSPRGDFHHTVVAFNDTVAHDPHPDGTGLHGPAIYKIVFVAVNPHQVIHMGQDLMDRESALNAILHQCNRYEKNSNQRLADIALLCRQELWPDKFPRPVILAGADS